MPNENVYPMAEVKEVIEYRSESQFWTDNNRYKKFHSTLFLVVTSLVVVGLCVFCLLV